MTPAQAAKLIGITAPQVRLLIRQGRIFAVRKQAAGGQFVYDIDRSDVLYYRRHRPKRGPKPGKPSPRTVQVQVQESVQSQLARLQFREGV